MGRNKSGRLVEARRLPNLYDRSAAPRGRWNERVFGRSAPLTIEVGCGRGEYSVGLARRFPERHFVGVDVKPLRMAQGARQALEEGLANVRFLQTDARELPLFFEKGEVDELWLPFPDPHPLPGDESKRLVASPFLAVYERILRAGAPLHFKTDNELLFRFGYATLMDRPGWKVEVVTADVHRASVPEWVREIVTHYEVQFASGGVPIFYLRARWEGV